MRESFRVWDNKLRAFVEKAEVFPFRYDFSDWKFVADEEVYTEAAKHLELVPSTGKLDIHWNMIYEWDILMVYNRNNWIVKCTWQEDLCWYVLQKVTGVTLSMSCRFPIEVIGNIRENPDLFFSD